MLDKLINIGNEIELKLIKIRESINAPLTDFSIEDVEIDIPGEELQELAAAHPDQPIFINNRFYFAYIRDNKRHQKFYHDKKVSQHPNQCFIDGKKVHFYYCRTLVEMDRLGRRKRYRRTTFTRNKRLIDLHDKNNVETRLPFCKNCINVLFAKTEVSKRDLNNVAEYGDAKDLMRHVKAHHEDQGNLEATKKTRDISMTKPLDEDYIEDLENDFVPSSYPKNWKQISKAFRKERKYKCEKCGVDCSKHQELIDTHHKNGDKNNCDYDNLSCLCKYCHSKEDSHQHYNVEKYIKDLKKLWKEQGINIDERNSQMTNPPSKTPTSNLKNDSEQITTKIIRKLWEKIRAFQMN